LLSIQNLHVSYGPIKVLKGVSLHIDQGEIVALIGANGAGKTTLMSTISGLLRPQSGEIKFEGQDIVKFPPDKIVKLGISLVPEGRQIFAPLTVLENLELGAYLRSKDKKGIKEDLDKIFSIFPKLKERKNQQAGTLSGGEQQMLAIARAFMARPRLLLLDEPSLGLAPMVLELIMDSILELNKEGLTILIVEQNAIKALEISTRGYVLETGRIILQGSSNELKEDPDVIRAYLGKDYEEITER